jgi:hypothetical protein
MKLHKLFALLLTVFILLPITTTIGKAMSTDSTILSSIQTIDPEILKYFPRWTVCQPEMQVKIQQAFTRLGFPANMLDINRITVTAAPKTGDYIQIILIQCGAATIKKADISKIGKVSAELSAKETYCYKDVPLTDLPDKDQRDAIINYKMPTNTTHSIVLSGFEQALKIGNEDVGFWIVNKLGTDEIGYHFWSAGEAKTILQRPLIKNDDKDSKIAIPFLVNAKLGYGYRLNNEVATKDFLNIIPDRKLSIAQGGKFIAGLELFAPFHPQAGINFNLELPLQPVRRANTVDISSYRKFALGEERFEIEDETGIIDPTLSADDRRNVVPILRATGQVTLFYNWWIDEKADNFFRADAGISYAEVREAAIFKSSLPENRFFDYLGFDAENLMTYKPNEFTDWLYLKLEYRNQKDFPFGMSVQYSNQIFLGTAYVPIFGEWLYLEGKYSTPLTREARPYELKNFFMISPVLRLTI